MSRPYVEQGKRNMANYMRRRSFAASGPMSPAERQALIDEAIAAGRVTKCPTGADGFRSIPVFNSLGVRFGTSKRGGE